MTQDTKETILNIFITLVALFGGFALGVKFEKLPDIHPPQQTSSEKIEDAKALEVIKKEMEKSNAIKAKDIMVTIKEKPTKECIKMCQAVGGGSRCLEGWETQISLQKVIDALNLEYTPAQTTEIPERIIFKR